MLCMPEQDYVYVLWTWSVSCVLLQINIYTLNWNISNRFLIQFCWLCVCQSFFERKKDTFKVNRKSYIEYERKILYGKREHFHVKEISSARYVKSITLAYDNLYTLSHDQRVIYTKYTFTLYHLSNQLWHPRWNHIRTVIKLVSNVFICSTSYVIYHQFIHWQLCMTHTHIIRIT